MKKGENWSKDLGENRNLIHVDGQEYILGGPSKSELKTIYALGLNVAKLFKVNLIQNIGFMTITFPKEVTTPKEAGKRFNSFNSHKLAEIRKAYIKVTEPHKDKRPHFHLLIALPWDIQSGFDWQSYQAAQREFHANGKTARFRKLRRKYSQSATPDLRRLWAEFRKCSSLYNLGRIEILPIRTVEEAAVKYIGKYIEKGSVHRVGAWKGARLTSHSKSLDRAANCQFAWVESGRKWRLYLKAVAQCLFAKDIDMLASRLGPKWAQKIMQCSILELSPEEAAALLVGGKFQLGPMQNPFGRKPREDSA